MPGLQSFFFRLSLKYLKATTDWNAPVEKLRASIEKGARLTRLPKNVDVKRMMAAGVPAEWLHPAHADPRKVILYLHGGGYAVGSCNSHRTLAARIARAGQADALLLDYRLAPESPYPAAIEDSIAAYHWLLRNHYLPQNITLVGDSAGGGLAIATLVSLRDNGASLPAAAVCISPLTDAEGTGESVMSNAKADPWLKPEAKARSQSPIQALCWKQLASLTSHLADLCRFARLATAPDSCGPR